MTTDDERRNTMIQNQSAFRMTITESTMDSPNYLILLDWIPHINKLNVIGHSEREKEITRKLLH